MDLQILPKPRQLFRLKSLLFRQRLDDRLVAVLLLAQVLVLVFQGGRLVLQLPHRPERNRCFKNVVGSSPFRVEQHPRSSVFLTQSMHLILALLQSAQLGINFQSCSTSARELIKGYIAQREESPAPGGIGTQGLWLMRCALPLSYNHLSFNLLSVSR